MLYTTAVALEAESVAKLARKNLSEYAIGVIKIKDMLPNKVINDLQELCLNEHLSFPVSITRESITCC